MSYALQEQYTSKNQVAGPDASSVWGLGPRKVTSITIHHWGEPGQQFDIVRDFLCTNNTPTSAHYVVQDGLVACIVSPDDCAFHAGNAEGNTFSVGIECRPEATDGDYQTVGELVAFLRGLYGDIPLYPHNHWFATACPGDYDLNRIDTIARSGTITPQSIPIPTAAEQDVFDIMTASPAEQDAFIQRFLDHLVTQADGNKASLGSLLQEYRQQHLDLVKQTTRPTINPSQAEDIVAAVTSRVPNAVLNAKFTLADGTVTNLAGILAAINAKPAATGTVTNVSADPQAIADAIVNGLNIQIVKK